MAKPATARDAVRDLVAERLTESAAGTSESIAVLHGSVLGHTLKPARFGGSATHTGEFVEQIFELTAIDGSLGWLAAMFNAAAYQVAALPMAEEVWGATPDALITSGHRGEARLTRDRRLTGRWESVVGAAYADWFLLPVSGGAAAPRVLVPRSAVRIDPGRPTGLSDAGIGDVTAARVPVADHHTTAEDAAVIAGAAAAAAVVGSADGLWHRHVEDVRARLATSYGGEEVSPRASAQVAATASDIDASKLQVGASVRMACDIAGTATALQQAVARARDATDRLLGVGRHALSASDPVTVRWRDVYAGWRIAVRLLEAL